MEVMLINTNMLIERVLHVIITTMFPTLRPPVTYFTNCQAV